MVRTCKAICSTRNRYSPFGVDLGIVTLTDLRPSWVNELKSLTTQPVTG